MRILLDTHVLVSALITTGTPPDLLHQAWESGSFALVTSNAQLRELARVFNYKKLQRYITREESENLLETIGAAALVVEELPHVEISRDPDDNAILPTAIAGEVDLLVTGDKSDLLQLMSVHGIPIVSPREVPSTTS